MATTTDMAPTRKAPAARARAKIAPSKSREQELEAQVSQLQGDLKDISETLRKLTGEKANEVKGMAQTEFRHLQQRGQHMIEDAQDQVGEAEKQLKDTIREKPLTAVATALGVGFVLALLTR